MDIVSVISVIRQLESKLERQRKVARETEEQLKFWQAAREREAALKEPKK